MLNKEDYQLIRNSALLIELPSSSAELILDQCTPRVCKANEAIYHTGDPADRIFFICNGVVQLFRGADEGKHAVLGIRERGQIAGLTALLAGRGHYSTAKTVGKARLLEIPARAFNDILDYSPVTAGRLVRLIADNVMGISCHMERLQLLQTTERLADYLLAHVNGNEGPTELTLPCDKGLIATYLGMERESFSRALAKLRPVGVITKGRHIQINDTSALKEFRDQIH